MIPLIQGPIYVEGMINRRRIVATALSFSLVIAACGGGTSTDDVQADAAAEATSTTATPTTASPETSPPTTVTTTTVTTTTTTAVTTTTTSPPTTTEAPVSSDSIDAGADYAEPSDDPLIEAVTQRMVASAEPGPVSVSEAEYRCISTGMVEDVGIRDILEASVTADGDSDFDPAKLSADNQDTMLNMLVTCVDIETLFADSMAADGELTQEQANCLAADLTERGLFGQIMRPLVGGGEVGDLSDQDADVQEAILEATLACLDLVERMAEEFAADGTVSEESARCLAETMDEQGLLDVIFDQGSEPTPDEDRDNQAAFIEIARGCLTTEEFLAISE